MNMYDINDIWENAQMLPELPMLKIKVDKLKCKIPNIRILHEAAVGLFERCLLEAAAYEGIDKVEFYVPADYDNDRLQIAMDVCLAMRFEAKKRGEYTDRQLFIRGFHREINIDGTSTLTVELIPEHAKIVHDYASDLKRNSENKNIELNYYDVCAAIIRCAWAADDDLRKWLHEGENA